MRNTPEEEAGDDPASSLLEGTLERKIHLQTKSFAFGKVVDPSAGAGIGGPQEPRVFCFRLPAREGSG
jgi:hypothetical protein